MDLAHWGFRDWPFERSFSSARFFAGSLHDEALARLLYLVEENRRFGIIMGPAGTGKTFLLKLLQHRAERMGRLTVRCDATGLEGHELASNIALGCHVLCDPDASNAKIWNGLNQRFMAMSLIEQPLVVIIDHFDFVHPNCLHTVRRLNQLADATGIKLSVIIGTREQTIPLALNELTELKIEIGPWSVEECSHFINSAIIRAGSTKNLFTVGAVSFIHGLTGGVPASVNSLCHLSLLAALQCGESLVTQEIVAGLSGELSSQSADQSPSTPHSNTRQMLVTSAQA